MVDVHTAKLHGVCPECEGYGGGDAQEQEDGSTCSNALCTGSCSACWCPGCHDGNVDCPMPASGERCGSWEAYEAVQGAEKVEPEPELTEPLFDAEGAA